MSFDKCVPKLQKNVQMMDIKMHKNYEWGENLEFFDDIVVYHIE